MLLAAMDRNQGRGLQECHKRQLRSHISGLDGTLEAMPQVAPLHYAREQMKVLVNNKSELSSLLKSKIKIGKLMW